MARERSILPKNAGIQNLVTGYTASSRIGCISCHNNDAWVAGGSNPAGSHGSMYSPLLANNYRTENSVTESAQNFALCCQCQDRNALTVDVAGKFPHARHLNKQSSCAACHDAHGSRQYPRLINFMLADKTGTAVVTPSTVQHRLEYIPTANGGQCYLMCHGSNHEPSAYP